MHKIFLNNKINNETLYNTDYIKNSTSYPQNIAIFYNYYLPVYITYGEI